MCLFPTANNNIKSIAYVKGLREFECGHCPECLAKRARLWALRCSAEAFYTPGIMVTLTYDSYKYDRNGNICGENPPVDLPLSKEHCQKFMKRLRKHFAGIKIKYLITAERGKRTNRSHYHAILFGVSFDDMIFYKKSKRGNRIYKSNTLTKIWGHGICTIDATNIGPQVARYCTKYCAKDSRCDDSFMLCSRGVGDRWLKEHFNGKSYMLDGREYTIPRQIWNWYISSTYSNNYVYNLRNADYRYRSLKWFIEKDDGHINPYHLFDYNVRQRRYFRAFRDSNKLYKEYLRYWSRRIEIADITRKTRVQRILDLPNDKYFAYKQASLKCFADRKEFFDNDVLGEYADLVYQPPRCDSQFKRDKYNFEVVQFFRKRYGLRLPYKDYASLCRCTSCHTTANDTRKVYFIKQALPKRSLFDVDERFKEKIVFLEEDKNAISPF